MAAGLKDLGLRRGENVAIIGDNRPRLTAAMLAAQSLGAIPVPLYQDAVAREMVYVFENAELRFAIVEDQEQVDKMLEIREQWPQLEHIVYDDPRGLRDYEQTGLLSYDSLVGAGQATLKEKPKLVSHEVEQGSPDDIAAMFYTSGTTGRPKGVIHTYRTLLSVSYEASRMEQLGENEEILAYLPPAWIGQNIFSFSQWLVCGIRSTARNRPRPWPRTCAIGPTFYFAPPRVLENLLTQVTIRMEDAAPFKRRMYEYFMGVARQVGERLLNGDATVGPMDKLRYRLGNFFVYGPLRNALGMSRVHLAYTAGEAIGPDLFVFYRSLGINLKQLYGSTETAVFVCVQPNGQVKADTVGPPIKGVELRRTDSGEILIRSPGLLREYYKNPEATAEVKDAEGWYHTGDAGYLDNDGHLKIIDRAKDVGKMASGQMFAPKYLENKLKFFPYIKEAVAIGDGRDKATVLINIDFPACGNWAERRQIGYAGYIDLANRDEIYDLVRDCVEKVNADLAADPMMSGSQMHRFLILHKELEADDGELTRTQKVRRGFIAERYAPLIAALYDGSTEQEIETPVTFEDGRAGSLKATVKIRDAKTFAAVQEAA
ncbi:MAG: AMP-binding protein [Burkholderiaceae bacterium]